jgi:hypothetical protein
MIDRFAWVVVLAPNQGCGGEGWEEEKGRRRREERMGAGCNFHTKTNGSNLSQTQRKMVETDFA